MSKILIVEDEILVGMMLQRNIESAGVGDCEIATTGKEAIQLAAKFQPDVMLMDFSLPGGMDGIEAASKIIQKRPVPVIFFSGNNRDKELLKRADAIHPVGVLDKMDSFEKLLKTLEKAIVAGSDE